MAYDLSCIYFYEWKRGSVSLSFWILEPQNLGTAAELIDLADNRRIILDKSKIAAENQAAVFLANFCSSYKVTITLIN